MRIVVYKNNLTSGRGADYAVRDVCGLLAEAHTVIFITEQNGPLSCAFDSRVSVIRIVTGHVALASAVSAANPDAIISTGTDEINALRTAFPETFPAPVIQQFHIYPPSAFKPRRWIRNFRTKQALRRCSAIQVLLPKHVEPTRQLIRFTGPVAAIGNLVPTNRSISTMPHSGENPVILYPAAFHKWKRQALLIRAFAQLKMQVPNAVLKLAGHGSVRDEMNLRRLATRLGVKDAVHFLGYVSDLSTALANASIVAFPSQMEGFGLVIVEAAAAGRLTIGCNDCMASRTLIREMGGLLASPTPTALATALAHGLKIASAYEVPRAALTAYSPDVIRAHWEALLKTMRKTRNPQRRLPWMNTELLLPFKVPHRTWWWPRIPRHNTSVCMLHSVGDNVSELGISPNNMIEPHALRETIQLLLAAGYRFLTFGEAFAGEQSPSATTKNERRICLTFDDGYADNYTELLPILESFKVCATVFCANLGEHDAHFLSANQIVKLDRSGLVEIGGHTVSHCRLAQTDPLTAQHEIEGNKAWLESVVGHKIRSFAYPYGDYDETVVELVRHAGYQCAATMEKNCHRPPRDAFHVHRQILPRGKSPYELYLLATRGKYKI